MQKKDVLIGLVVTVGLACGLFVLFPEPRPTKTIEASRGPEPGSNTETFLFQLERDSPEITLWLSTNLLAGELAIEILDDNGEALGLPYELDKREYQCLILRPARGFRAGGLYQLRITERHVVGRYRIVVARQEAGTICHRCLQVGALLALVIGSILVHSRI